MSVERREFLKLLGGLAAAPLAMTPLFAAAREETWMSIGSTAQEGIAPLRKPKSEWKKLLEPRAYAVLFEEGTERPGSSPLDHEKRAGTFTCSACFLPLFSSSTKFDSGTGWPSFYAPLPGHVGTKRDFKLVLPRTEYHCIRCGGHQGHIFKDGPPPTGLRYCNNGLALAFVPEGQPLPALRT